ncbi:PqqD family protein [Paenibacillus popilliae]|uniref:Coenzyme PQQ synthesis protein D n=1 Tax=Paenibacillus popilliae ATCC 14706 TaxID=1212764 RepID=M9LPE1_PAEPP|nr:PqqD family protein [Paenibacillus popilliae]GAC42396.1 hypothetical protein PPOP_1753 [Paenibacillus popilliae ATCC 14706]
MYQINTFIKCSELYDEYVIVDTRTGEYYELNEIGNLFFREIISAKDEISAISTLQEKIEASPETLTVEYGRFIKKLVDDGIVNPNRVEANDK